MGKSCGRGRARGGAYQDVVGLDVSVQDVAAFQQLERQEELLAVGAHRLDVEPHVLPVLLQHLPQVHAERWTDTCQG